MDRHALLLTLVGLLAAGAGAVLTWDAAMRPKEQRIAMEFQTLVRGLGMGPAVDLSGCAFALDPRLAVRCGSDLGPIPSGSAYCPYHSLSIFSYPTVEKAVQDARLR